MGLGNFMDPVLSSCAYHAYQLGIRPPWTQYCPHVPTMPTNLGYVLHGPSIVLMCLPCLPTWDTSSMDPVLSSCAYHAYQLGIRPPWTQYCPHVPTMPTNLGYVLHGPCIVLMCLPCLPTWDMSSMDPVLSTYSPYKCILR